MYFYIIRQLGWLWLVAEDLQIYNSLFKTDLNREKYIHTNTMNDINPVYAKQLEEAIKQAVTTNQLELRNRQLDTNSIRIISQHPWHKLELINLKINKIKDAGIKILCRMQLHNLKNLQLSDSDINDAGISHLSKACFPKLQELSLGDNRWASGIEKITKGSFKNMKWVSFSPYNGNKSSKMTIYNVNNLMKADWNKLEVVFLPIALISRERDTIRSKYIEWVGNQKLYLQFV